ncbi:unnamed protein product [Moneuplotes crassus]|uniref:Uncharacterized protein n=1 Tax=Euplotes crassus TaxID=5936 RepID=A0AAD1U8M9_EUPCR|nr:unnamed protein product [Moneuplotes crassus]
MLQITAEEINFIIYQYLQESGFSHSAYTFGKECNIIENKFKHYHIPAAMLVVFLEKALTLIHIETHYNEGDDMVACNEPFTLLNPHHCSTVIREPKAVMNGSVGSKGSLGQNPIEGILNNSEGNTKKSNDQDQEMEDDSKKQELKPPDSKMALNNQDSVYGATHLQKSSFLQNYESRVRILVTKSTKTLKVAWNPKRHMLAFGGDNEFSSLWNIGDNVSEAEEISTLPHVAPDLPSMAMMHTLTTINSIDWKPDGNSFITGSSDGICRMWDTSGSVNAVMFNEDSMVLSQKAGTSFPREQPKKAQVLPNDVDSIFDCKWNKDGSALVSVSEKNNVILWNPEGKLRASYQGHTDSVTTIDWKNNNMFATGSQDGVIKVWDVQSSTAQKTLNYHESGIKCLQWDPTGAFLASGSEDCTIQIWNNKHDKIVVSFNDHKEMIHNLKWSPTGYGSSLPNAELRLASGSADGTVKIWSLAENKLVDTLTGHTGMVMCLDFDPTYTYLTSGDDSGRVIIWSVKDGTIVKTFESQTKNCIFDTKWSHDGQMLAICDKDVSVIDIRYM